MQEFKLPPYVEENEEDSSRFSDIQGHESYAVIIKKLNNRVAEHAQQMVTEKDLEYATRIDEVLSIISELTNE